MPPERRQITPEQAQHLERYLTQNYGPPKVEKLAVDDDGTIHTTEAWGDEVETHSRRIILGRRQQA